MMKDVLGSDIGISVDLTHEAGIRYVGSSIGLQTSKDIIPYQIAAFNVNSKGEHFWRGYLFSLEEERFINTEYVNIPYKKEELVYNNPPPGFINVKGEGNYLLSKSPTKQWKRGVTIEQYELLHPFSREYRFLSLESRLVSTLMGLPLYYAYNRVFYKADEAYDKIINSEIVSGALSLDFALSLRVGFNYPILYYRQFMIGVMNKNKEFRIVKEAEDLIDDLKNLAPVRVLNDQLR